MAILGIEPVVLGAAMLQSGRWRERLDPKWRQRTIAVLELPILSKTAGDRWIGATEPRAHTNGRAANSAPRAPPRGT